MRVIVLTSSPHGTASRCLPALVASKKVEVLCVVLAEGFGSSNVFKARKRKFKKALKIGILGALNGIRIRKWYQGPPTEHIETLCPVINWPNNTLCILIFR